MTERVWRWACYGPVLGLLPLALAWFVRTYYLGRAPTLVDLLGTGDALLIAVAWAAAALLDLSGAARASPGVRLVVAALSVFALGVSVVAYACLSTDSVTARVQTRGQQLFLTHASLAVLGAAALAGGLAAGMAHYEKQED